MSQPVPTPGVTHSQKPLAWRLNSWSAALALLARRLVSWSAALALLAGLLPAASAPTTSAAESLPLPFPGGQSVKIIQGYNGGSHQGRSRYGLDLALAQGNTSGAEVVSPIDGSVVWAFAPGTGNGCIGIAQRGGSYSVTLCHVILSRGFGRGESIERGQRLGTVGPPGTVGNNGAPHVHLELHRGGGANNPVPFSSPGGLPLEGVDLPASGGYNQHSARAAIVSTNGGGGGSQPVFAAQPQPKPLAARPAAPAPQAAAPAPESRTSQSATLVAVSKPNSSRAAIVSGTDACLNVRERPAKDAPIVTCVPEGTEIALASTLAGPGSPWRQTEAKGWVASDYLKRSRAVVSGTEGCLNVREKPSTSAAVVTCLAEGTSVAIAEGPSSSEEYHWYRIASSESGQKAGWAVGKYLD
jgi:uncharacterized protein YraI